MAEPDPTPPSEPKRLYRSRDDRMLAGVCGGIARYVGIDPTIVRLLTVAAAVLSVGAVVLAYLAAWLIVPEEPLPA